jgi:hypothetical protein
MPAFIPGLGPGFEVLASTKYDHNVCVIEMEVDLEGEYFLVPSASVRGHEGAFTLAALTWTVPMELVRVEAPLGASESRLEGAWSKDVLQGPFHRPGEHIFKGNYKPPKAWSNNPQFRLWIDPNDMPGGSRRQSSSLTGGPGGGLRAAQDALLLRAAAGAALGEDVDVEAGITARPPPVHVMVIISTDSADLVKAGVGVHVVRNKESRFFNEVIEVLPRDFVHLCGGTSAYSDVRELAFEIELDREMGLETGIGCREAYPFFVVPSISTKKGKGSFTIQVLADAAVVLEPVPHRR